MAQKPNGTWDQLSQRTLTIEQIRNVDRIAIERYGMNSLVLMENAAVGCVQWIRERHANPGHVIILCGSGNNGGDGLVIARHLEALGWRSSVVLNGTKDRLSGDNRANLEILMRSLEYGPACSMDIRFCDVSVTTGDKSPSAMTDWLASISSDQESDGPVLLIDAMLGTAARGEPRPPYREWIEVANAASVSRIAIDIPTGVDAETGDHGECYFAADATLTFVAPKPAMADPAKRRLFGELAVIPIGTPFGLNAEILAAAGNDAQETEHSTE